MWIYLVISAQRQVKVVLYILSDIPTHFPVVNIISYTPIVVSLVSWYCNSAVIYSVFSLAIFKKFGSIRQLLWGFLALEIILVAKYNISIV